MLFSLWIQNGVFPYEECLPNLRFCDLIENPKTSFVLWIASQNTDSFSNTGKFYWILLSK